MGFSERYGARAMRRTALREIEEPIATMIVAGEITPNAEIVVGVTKGRITIRQQKAIAG